MSRAPNTPLPAGWVAPGWIVGLDLSLTGLGMVAVPAEWNLDWSRVLRKSLESDPQAPLVDRIRDLAIDVQRWVDWVQARHAVPCSVWIEGSITGRAQANTVRSQLKLAGAVEHELRRENAIICQTAEQHSVRKLLLGRYSSRDGKDPVLHALRQMIPDADDWYEDELDAFAVANYGLAQVDAPFVTIARSAA